jgi:hypothetical protein
MPHTAFLIAASNAEAKMFSPTASSVKFHGFSLPLSFF